VKDGISKGENFVMRSSELNCKILGREPISSVDVYLSRKIFLAKSTAMAGDISSCSPATSLRTRATSDEFL